ncbi:hypothetical protein BamIOP4010DRAFT_6808 [Burkholderia ambifaria IOP40-10]|uniref:Uncharacterized protein n=1 Tax=Burkholderia ambifaria IOP40-10 TaxID=396596 RepID=B1FRZ5_9BURK|nr:hypothetical protein BamIOP4010DRAFT_6808 [Burkholderia ambifaria IOP40-10]
MRDAFIRIAHRSAAQPLSRSNVHGFVSVKVGFR